jgi:hypothetical protein
VELYKEGELKNKKGCLKTGDSLYEDKKKGAVFL